MLKACPDCGAPTPRTYCDDHRRPERKASATQRGYDSTWNRLSRRARRLQPWCSDCGSVEDLTVDHSQEAWLRKEAGLPIRLVDVDVVCRACNSRRGRARPGGPPSTPSGPTGKAKFGSHIEVDR